MTDAVGVRQTRVKLRAAFPHQPGQPVPRERPKIVTPTVAPGADLPAETRVAGINRIGARGEFANPTSWQRLAQPDAGLLANGLHDGARHDGCVGFNSEYALFHVFCGSVRAARIKSQRDERQ